MMESSSKKDMEKVFHYLSAIKQVDPCRDLYTNTLNKLNKQKRIPLYWMSLAASLLVLIISAEMYVAYNIEHSAGNEISDIVYITNNHLYNE